MIEQYKKAVKDCTFVTSKDINHFEYGKEHFEIDGNKITVFLQNGPIKENGVNGIQVSDLLEYIKNIYVEFNKTFQCVENSVTIDHLNHALDAQDKRTKDREKRGVEGLNKI
jgi:arginine/lysine/ornithine decarboxylase